MELIFLDTETTGNDIAKDRLCQLCYKISGQPARVGYFKPPLPVSIKAMSITHITNKMLADKEPFEGSGMKQHLKNLLTTGILVAHNARFDRAILEAEGIQSPKFICTLRVARHLDEKGSIPEYNLQYLRYYLDLDIEGNAHDAEADVYVLEALFGRLLSKIKDKGDDELAAIQRMMDISAVPSLYRNFSFGKHAGKLVEDVAKTDRGYLEWFLNQKLTAEDQDEDWIYTLKHYLKK